MLFVPVLLTLPIFWIREEKITETSIFSTIAVRYAQFTEGFFYTIDVFKLV